MLRPIYVVREYIGPTNEGQKRRKFTISHRSNLGRVFKDQ